MMPLNAGDLIVGGETTIPRRLPKLPPDANEQKYILQWVQVGASANDATRRHELKHSALAH